MNSFTIKAQLVDIFNKNILPAAVTIQNHKIASIEALDAVEVPWQYILPGFVDAHIHVESAMLSPYEFARMACAHGTVATISDPHEIANVCGEEGVAYMIEHSKNAPVKIFFGAPSCVPATTFETSGAVLDAAKVQQLLQNPDIWYLTEVMNYPGVLHNDPGLMAKIAAAKQVNKPIDGHAPGLRGEMAMQYAAHGISTDHECFTLEEALDKIAAGMKILIREGSAARNYEALAPLLASHPDKVMFCSDDKHPDELELHHINSLVQRAISDGYPLFDVLRAACLHPVEHYRIPVGLLRVGDPADFIVVDNLKDFTVRETYNNGIKVAENGECLLPYRAAAPLNNFNAEKRHTEEFACTPQFPGAPVKVIEVLDGQLITDTFIANAKLENNNLVSDVEQDILKIAVVNRYEPKAPIAKGFIKNIGLKNGAIASTVAHDSHNIIAAGVSDAAICAAVNALVATKGGIVVHDDRTGTTDVLALEIAGLMSTAEGREVARAYTRLDQKAKELGSTLKAPFMSLSFMALLVIPSLKLSDKGLFDGNQFTFTGLELHS